MTDATDDLEDEELRWSFKKSSSSRNNFSTSIPASLHKRIREIAEEIKEELDRDEIIELIDVLREVGLRDNCFDEDCFDEDWG